MELKWDRAIDPKEGRRMQVRTVSFLRIIRLLDVRGSDDEWDGGA